MLKTPVVAAVITLAALTGHGVADDSAGMVRNGANAYRACAACHSLQPGVHLSGPSLDGLWGKVAGTVAGFGRYTGALKGSGVVWDEDTLNAWLANPQAMVPGTTMAFRGIEADDARRDLVAFLRRALAEGGAAKVVREGLIPNEIADGQIPSSLTAIEPDQEITAIRHCGDAFFVTTAAGARIPLWETNVRLKIDTSERGPENGKAVLLGSGMAGDRVSIVFPSLAALQQLLEENCQS